MGKIKEKRKRIKKVGGKEEKRETIKEREVREETRKREDKEGKGDKEG